MTKEECVELIKKLVLERGGSVSVNLVWRTHFESTAILSFKRHNIISLPYLNLKHERRDKINNKLIGETSMEVGGFREEYLELVLKAIIEQE